MSLSSFSRPVLHFKIQPLEKASSIHVYVCHLKSKAPTLFSREPRFDRDIHSRPSEALGAAISTIRRTTKATVSTSTGYERRSNSCTILRLLFVRTNSHQAWNGLSGGVFLGEREPKSRHALEIEFPARERPQKHPSAIKCRAVRMLAGTPVPCGAVWRREKFEGDGS